MKNTIKNIDSITLGELMGEDHDIWIYKDKTFGYRIQIDDENGSELVLDEQINPYALEGFAEFCRRYLASYERVLQQEAA